MAAAGAGPPPPDAALDGTVAHLTDEPFHLDAADSHGAGVRVAGAVDGEPEFARHRVGRGPTDGGLGAGLAE